jgi:hypothetical protein
MIFFNVESVREYLIKHGHVYTVRKATRRTGKDVAVHGNYYKQNRIGRVEVFPEIPELTSAEQLEPYVGSSGLPSAEKWFNKAVKLHKNQPMGLFHVILCVHEEGIN